MAIISAFATPSSFTLQSDGRTQTAYSGERAGTAPSDTEITMLEIAAQGIPETLFCRIKTGANFAAMGATFGIRIYFDAIRIYESVETLGLTGGLPPEIEIVIPRGAAFKLTTLNDGASGLVSRYTVANAWALRSKPFRVL
ncbi:MAG TPA: hypothetical protein EYN66_12800 [Myxococcales bacterium]|nr:hypothetical protein [Myxococcales bacterium]